LVHHADLFDHPQPCWEELVSGICNSAQIWYDREMGEPLRMPISTAARRGVSALATTAEQRRVVLTNTGRPTAVVDSAERIDEDMRQVRDAARTVVDAYAQVAAGRTVTTSLEQLCARLGLDEAQVRARAAELAGE